MRDLWQRWGRWLRDVRYPFAPAVGDRLSYDLDQPTIISDTPARGRWSAAGITCAPADEPARDTKSFGKTNTGKGYGWQRSADR